HCGFAETNFALIGDVAAANVDTRTVESLLFVAERGSTISTIRRKYDAIIKGDCDGSDVGTRTILLTSFTGGPSFVHNRASETLSAILHLLIWIFNVTKYK
ncbi:hypothetical protein Tco_1063223, partial [Tanacetum coccineum]